MHDIFKETDLLDQTPELKQMTQPTNIELKQILAALPRLQHERIESKRYKIIHIITHIKKEKMMANIMRNEDSRHDRTDATAENDLH